LYQRINASFNDQGLAPREWALPATAVPLGLIIIGLKVRHPATIVLLPSAIPKEKDIRVP
jgi:hypothetical protein